MEEIIRAIAQKTDSKIVLVVLDGLGDLPVEGKTPLEAARTPTLDELAGNSALGLLDPIARGITPGSGPGHLGLFGYDPLQYEVGRGVLEALGIGLDLEPEDVAVRGNFATVDENGVLTDRRAGRLPTDENKRICAKLQRQIRKIEDVSVQIEPVMDHRFALVLRGPGLGSGVADTDPQKTGLKPLPVTAVAQDRGSRKTARIAERFVFQAMAVLKDEVKANAVLLRGFGKLPKIPKLQELYKLTPAVIAGYPMYRGLARLIGMEILPLELGDERLEEKMRLLREHWERFDFFFIHIKRTDSAGEDGNFSRKVELIEEFDAHLPEILALEPDVLAITADHSTPVPLRSHSWHPVPLLLHSRYIWPGGSDQRFTERACRRGGLGRFRAVELMPELLAHALKLQKFGA
ncbi:MAG: 2,3-bisphosphoglycerate-independent phosphoglycerate mutase [Candidatus Acetothermia bacterium]|jgi:2,3-bisphosphoglycerate-independent phosphoglycerate mutase|nr:2,3-bisphosphoglycerate-independent phosphoglycerate mutase [Candidatus Acetothermia bacterium]MDH7504627.1 2,3-bisphosphoglycerate-independent phosphoglycerate mutase [Candidatus Acetothermia bacterium]